MSAFALISGRLRAAAVTRQSAKCEAFTTFRLRVASGVAVDFWDVVVFDKDARAELDGLAAGASVSASGEMSVEAYDYRGETRLARRLTADRVLALRSRERREPRPRRGAAREIEHA